MAQEQRLTVRMKHRDLERPYECNVTATEETAWEKAKAKFKRDHPTLPTQRILGGAILRGD